MRTAAKKTQDTMNNTAIAAPPAKMPRSRKSPAPPSAAPLQSVVEEAPSQQISTARPARSPRAAKAVVTEPAVKAAWKGMDDNGPKLPKPSPQQAPDTQPVPVPKPKTENGADKAPDAVKEKPAVKATPVVVPKEKPAAKPAPVKEPQKTQAIKSEAVVASKNVTVDTAPILALKPVRTPKTAAKPPAAARPVSAKARIASAVAAAVKARAASKPPRVSAPAKAAPVKAVATRPSAAVEKPAIPAVVKTVVAKTAAPSSRSTGARQVKPQPALAGRGKPEPREKAVVQPVLILESGHLWRMTGNHAVAYVRRASDACAILRATPGELADRAMAVYRDRQGRAIAWQVRFETARWAEVEGMLNMSTR